jgi:hypothetical protein
MTRAQMMRRRAMLRLALDRLTQQVERLNDCRDALAHEIERLAIEIVVAGKPEPLNGPTFIEFAEMELAQELHG